MSQTRPPEKNTTEHDETFSTRRVISPGLEDILYEAFPVLDHGFVRVVDYMGADSSIVQAARVSYGKGTKQVTADLGLIKYLLRHRHTTPFEMCEIKFHLKMPIFVARQWLRHRTANVNEYSARYSILDNEFYVPDEQNLAAQSKSNRQGREALLEGEEKERALHLLKRDGEQTYASYQELLNMDEEGNISDEKKKGLARELARANLPVSFYTQMYWKIDLHNLMHFLKLRADAHSQYEIRVYANKMIEILRAWLPLTFEAFREYVLEGTYLSASALQAVKMKLSGEKVDPAALNISPREWREILEKIDLE